MRISTFLVCIFLSVVAMPAMLLVSDLFAINTGVSVWVFRVMSFFILMGLLDTLFKVDSMIRRNIAMGER